MSKKPSESSAGIALITAMMMLLLLALLAAVMTVWSQRLWLQADYAVRSENGTYALESAAARAIWLLANDLNLYPERVNLDEVNYDLAERFVADGRVHYFKSSLTDYWFEVRIVDFFSGIQLEVDTADDMLDFVENTIKTSNDLARYKVIKSRIWDYIDTDSGAREKSFEQREYEKLQRKNLPRNDIAVFPEEYAWIPGFTELFPPDEYGRITWLQRKNFPQTKPNIFAAPRELIYLTLDADAAQRKNIDAAFKSVIADQYTLKFSLDLVDSSLYEKLDKEFSFKESGYYVLLVRPMLESRLRGRSMELAVHFEETGINGMTGKIELISWRLL